MNMTSHDEPTTEFAPAGRADLDTLRRQIDDARASIHAHNLCDAVPSITVILNRQRQTIFRNRCLLETLEVPDPDILFGQRPGEFLGCIHARETPGGCGTTEHCSTCGAVLAVMATQNTGERDVRECRITRRRGDGSEECLDFRVFTDAIEVRGETYTVLSLMDIGHEKRREVLERVFFHDVRNTVGSLLGFIELMRELAAAEPEKNELLDAAVLLTNQLTSEIENQEALLAAESNRLSVRTAPIRSLSILTAAVRRYQPMADRAGIELRIDPKAVNTEFESDPVLIDRVLDNMIKNALEASSRKDGVTVGCEADAGMVRFWVRNPGAMRRDVQLQVFQRSFSTKGRSRGIGTYSMKLLTERYLGGQVDFSSDPRAGTRFWVSYPRRFQAS